MVSCPVTDAVLVGLNWIEITIACPGFRVAGTVSPVTENPVPEIGADVIVTGAVPVEVTVIDFETAVPVETLPKAREVALKVSTGVNAFNWKPKLCADELALAVIVAL